MSERNNLDGKEIIAEGVRILSETVFGREEIDMLESGAVESRVVLGVEEIDSVLFIETIISGRVEDSVYLFINCNF